MKTRLIAAGIAAVAVFAASAAAVTTATVTLKVERLPDGRARYSGAISGGGAGEYVAIMQQKCGSSFSTAVAGTTTEQGGFFAFDPLGTLGSGTYRAKWGSDLSAPVTIRLPVRILLQHYRGRRHLANIQAEANLNGRFVELQRLSGGRWLRVRRARLEPGGGAYFFIARFHVRRKGLRLRIFVPRGAAAPCHLPSASETFTS